MDNNNPSDPNQPADQGGMGGGNTGGGYTPPAPEPSAPAEVPTAEAPSAETPVETPVDQGGENPAGGVPAM